MRIEQNLLHRAHHQLRNPLSSSATNGHSNGLYNSNSINNNHSSATDTTAVNNKRNQHHQEKEVEQDIPVRKSSRQETENGNEEKPSFLNPELQRELNRILAEAEEDGVGKLSGDSSEDSSEVSGYSFSSSEEDDEYEHPRRLFLEEIAEEDEEDLEEEEEENDENDEVDEEDEEISEEEDEKYLDQSNLNCGVADEDVNDDDGDVDEEDDDDRNELEFCSDSDATLTNECGESEETEIESGIIKARILHAYRKEHCNYSRVGGNGNVAGVEILFKVENVDDVVVVEDDSSSAPAALKRTEWGNEQIDGKLKEKCPEHARGETGISTGAIDCKAAEAEPVMVVAHDDSKHGKDLKKEALHCKENQQQHQHYNAQPAVAECSQHEARVNGESVCEVSQQPLKFLQQKNENNGEEGVDEEFSDDYAYHSTPYTNAAAVAGQEKENSEEDEEDDDDDDYDDDEEESDSSSIGEFEDELERKHHEHVEIRLFHEGDEESSSSNCSSISSSTAYEKERIVENISREWNRESKCVPSLVECEATTSTEVHEERPGESGTGSSSSTLSTKATTPIKEVHLPSVSPISSSSLLSNLDKHVSFCESVITDLTTSEVSELPPTVSSPNSILGHRDFALCNKTVPNSECRSSSINIAKTASSSPSVLIISPKTSPLSDSSYSSSSLSNSSTLSSSLASTSSSENKRKLKRVSFHEQIESKTYYSSEEPSSVSSSVSDFNPSQYDKEDDDKNEEGVISKVKLFKNRRKKSLSKTSSNNLPSSSSTEQNSLVQNQSSSNTSSFLVESLNPQEPTSSPKSQSPTNSSSFFNNSQFSTADFWAVRNGSTDNQQNHQLNHKFLHQQYLQSFYYSESDNSPPSIVNEEIYQASLSPYPQHLQQSKHPISSASPSKSINHQYYYPTEYFNFSDSNFTQNSSLGLPLPHPSQGPSSSSSLHVLPLKEFHSKKLPATTTASVNEGPLNSLLSSPVITGNQFLNKKTPPFEQHQSTITAGVDVQTPPSPSSTISSLTATRPTSLLDNNRNAEMHQRLSGGEQRLRSVLRKPGVGGVKKSRGERSVTFNESLNLFYEAECSCWIHEDDYHRMRAEEQAQAAAHQQQQQQQHPHHHQQFIYEQTHPHFPHTHHHHQHQQHQQNFIYEPPPIEFEDPPTLSPPEGYKDRFFPQEDPTDPDVTRVCPPSPPSARRKVFLKENSTDQLPPPPQQPQQKGVILNGLEDEEEDEESKKSNNGGGNTNSGASKGSRLGGILKGGRLWRSNSAEGKKVTSPPDEPDVVKCTERDGRLSEKDPADRTNAVPSGPSSPQNQVQIQENYQGMPTKVSTGTAPLRTSEQIRLAVDSTLRLRTKKSKPECSSLVEKLRWLTSLDDEDPSDSSSQSGFATWPSRDKNGSVTSTSSSKKSDAGTSTNEEFVNSAGIRQPPPIYSSSEAKIKQISYTLEDIDEGLKGSEIELESFITEDGGRIERLKKRYSGEEPGDDYGFSRRPSVKGIKPKFSSTNQIFAQYTAMRASGTETPVPVESQYENTRGLPPPASFDHQIPNHLDGARITQQQQLNYEIQNATGRPPEESRAHFEMIRQSFEHAANFSNFNRPHSWSVSTLPHPHHAHAHSNSISMGSAASPPPTSGVGGLPPNLLSNNFGSSLSVSQPMQQPQNNLSMNNASPITMNNATGAHPGAPEGIRMINPNSIYGTLPTQAHIAAQQAQQQQMGQAGQAIYGTVRRVPNVIGRPLFLHYGALSVEAHPNKIVQPFPRPTKVPETPSPTQQPPPLRYYGPPIRYYNSPPPVPPRSVTTTVSTGNPVVPGNGVIPNQAIPDCQQERGVPEGATDEEPSLKESYSMNV